MDAPALRQSSYAEALAALQDVIGAEVLVYAGLAGGRLFGTAFRATLRRVRSLPPDDDVIVLEFSSGQVLQVTPEEVETFAGYALRGERSVRWIEFHIVLGPVVTVEELPVA
jgi:hypothetical protein